MNEIYFDTWAKYIMLHFQSHVLYLILSIQLYLKYLKSFCMIGACVIMHIAQNLVYFHYLKSISICLGGMSEYFMSISKYRNVGQLELILKSFWSISPISTADKENVVHIAESPSVGPFKVRQFSINIWNFILFINVPLPSMLFWHTACNVMN